MHRIGVGKSGCRTGKGVNLEETGAYVYISPRLNSEKIQYKITKGKTFDYNETTLGDNMSSIEESKNNPGLRNTAPKLQHHFYSGLSGLQLPIPKYLFPPPFENASRLTYYASHFNSIEINSSFYKIPKSGTVAKWSASVPGNFRFTFKLWKGITHNKGLDFKYEDVVAFFNAINSVKEKKGCLLIQFPPIVGSEYRLQLENLLSCINETDPAQDWKVAVEFRNKSWYNEEVYDLMNSYKATMVIQDIPKSATPLLNHKSDFLYLRFHGPTGNYRESYSEDFLKESAALINEWKEEGKTVYVYFNNTMGDAYNNLKTLNAFIHS